MWGCSGPTLQILPVEPTTADVIQALLAMETVEFIAITDVDWYRDGFLTVEARELNPNWTSRGQVWGAEVTLENGTVLMSDTVEIFNALPDVTLTVDPRTTNCRLSSHLLCGISDADEDDVSHTVYWESSEGIRIDSESFIT